MARVIRIRDGGGFEHLSIEDVEVSAPAPGEVQVRWHATSLNFHDYLVAAGQIPVADGRVPMSDGAGEIVAVGAGVSQWQVGDHVMSTFFPGWRDGAPTLPGMMAVTGETVDGFAVEQSNISADTITAIPDGYSFAQAATLPCAALTAWRALVIEGRIKAGDSVLVEGTGGLSLFCLQIAKAAGAEVYATSSSAEKLDKLKALGADHVINYREDENWGKTVLQLSGGGVDHVIDVGGGATIYQSTEAAKIGGHIVLVGILGGRKGEIVFPKYFFKQLRLSGIAVGSHAMQSDMVAAINVNGFTPVIDRSFTLDALAEAFAYQASNQQFGKIVVEYGS
ncbi:MAG: NAD(P)-dependent alcohol dehydrogenase [Pseudomonadota bacterium]